MLTHFNINTLYTIELTCLDGFSDILASSPDMCLYESTAGLSFIALAWHILHNSCVFCMVRCFVSAKHNPVSPFVEQTCTGHLGI